MFEWLDDIISGGLDFVDDNIFGDVFDRFDVTAFSDTAEMAGDFFSGRDSYFSAAVESGALNDMITGAVIGTTISHLTDNNMWMGAGLGAVGGFASSGTDWDIGKMLFDKGTETSKVTDAFGETKNITKNTPSMFSKMFSGENVAAGVASYAETKLETEAAEKLAKATREENRLARTAALPPQRVSRRRDQDNTPGGTRQALAELQETA